MKVVSVLCVRISDGREDAVSATWKAHQCLFNGTVERLCPIILSEINEPQSELSSAAEATCSLFGPSARRLHNFTFLSVTHCA